MPGGLTARKADVVFDEPAESFMACYTIPPFAKALDLIYQRNDELVRCDAA